MQIICGIGIMLSTLSPESFNTSLLKFIQYPSIVILNEISGMCASRIGYTVHDVF